MSIYKRAVKKYKNDGVVELLKSAHILGKNTIVSNLPRVIRRRLNSTKSKEELHEYWGSRSNSEELPYDGDNLPEDYLDGSERSEFLVDIISEYSEKTDKVLELGCNIGRNLHFLYKNGWESLYSVEINPNALERLEREFPKLSQDTELYNSSIEDKITEFEDNEFDICFTMAVLEHMHPESEWIFGEMTRITSQYIILVEDEEFVSWRHEPRRYAEIFTNLGCELVETIPRDKFPGEIELGSGFKMHIFQPK